VAAAGMSFWIVIFLNNHFCCEYHSFSKNPNGLDACTADIYGSPYETVEGDPDSDGVALHGLRLWGRELPWRTGL
jgi:hypothetical protein